MSRESVLIDWESQFGLISSGKPVVDSFHFLFSSVICFVVIRKKNASLKLRVQMLIKEGLAQSVVVLGACSSIMWQDPSVLVWSLGDNSAFISCNETSPLSHPVVPIT